MNEELTVTLRDAEATLEIGRILGEALAGLPHPPALLLSGDLGSGKTTLTRGLVAALPGAEDAEVSSPSFNIVNLYPTRPEVAHFDLYRLEGLPPDEEVLDRLACGDSLNVVEWAQFLGREDRPPSSLELHLRALGAGREARIGASGAEAQTLLEALRPRLRQFNEAAEKQQCP